MFFRASPPLLSDDDSYEYTRRRPRRRSSRRHRPNRYDSKSYRYDSSGGNCARFVIITALVCLLIYEVVVLHSPISKRSKQSSTSTTTSNIPPPPSSSSSSSSSTTTNANTNNNNALSEEQNSRLAELAARARAIEEAAAARDREALRRQKERIAAAAAQAAPVFDLRPDPNDIRPPEERLAASRQAANEMRSHPGTGENFWEWYQKSRKGGKIECKEPHKRICEMTYKFVRKYRIRTLYDADCSRTSPWMKIVLMKTAREIWGFRYICANPSIYTRKSLYNIPYVTYTNDRWWRSGFPPDIDLVFAWDVLAHTAYGRVWSFFVNVRRANVKYVLVDNYPGILNDPSPERFYLNLRKHPFRFPAAKEVVQNVTQVGETANRQLLFYETPMLPDNLG